MQETFDAVVVGASIAGCTAATLLGRRGLRVAVLDRVSDENAYKKVCTHFIQAYALPNDGGLTILVTMPTKDKLPAFRADLEGSFRRMFEGLPRGPRLEDAERVGDFVGMLEMPNTIRRASAPGIAFVGDAAMASDPMFGVGCGWAFQTGEWLADDVGDALASRAGVAEALETYARHHEHRLGMHHEMINQASRGQPFGFVDRLVFGAAANDEGFARDFGRLMSRLTNPRDVLGPRLLLRAAWAKLTGKTREPATLPAGSWHPVG